MNIPFNNPRISGKEFEYIRQTANNGYLSGNGPSTKQFHSFIRERYGLKDCLLTTSCATALEMAAILINIRSGDEVIVPSFSLVSTAPAFERQGFLMNMSSNV